MATKADIMKLTEGRMQRVGEAVLREHPALAHEPMIVDNCAHQMVVRPEQFDVVVMTNMNGDILSHLAAEPVGAWASRLPATSATSALCSRPSTAPRRGSSARAWPIRRRCCSRPS